jgi:hypothetical protein
VPAVAGGLSRYGELNVLVTEELFHHLKVVPEKQSVHPAVTVGSETTDPLERNQHCVRDDFLSSLLTFVDEYVLAPVWWEKVLLPLRIEVLTRVQYFNDSLSLLRCHLHSQ